MATDDGLNADAAEMPLLITDDLEDPAVLAQWAERFAAARLTAEYQAVFDKPEPLVSVCITTADRADVLADKALRSMTEQTYRHLDVIIVGDACDDHTAETVAGFRDPRFRFENLAERGPYPPPGYNRWLVAGTNPANRALELARGDFVTHLDEDDTFHPERIAIMVDAVRRARADLGYHPFWWEHEDRSLEVWGDGRFEIGQTGTSMVLYHRWLRRVPWNLHAYVMGEPGDWNRFKKFKAMGVNLALVDQPLTWHWKYPLRGEFEAKPGERYLPEPS